MDLRRLFSSGKDKPTGPDPDAAMETPSLTPAEVSAAVRPTLAMLDRARIFDNLGLEFRQALARSSTVLSLYRGQTLMEEGEDGHEFYIILSGRVSIQIETIAPYLEIGINRVGPGEVIGEISLFEDQPRSATVVASEPCELIAMDARKVRELAQQYPVDGTTFYRNVGQTLALRLRDMNRKVMNMVRSRYY